MLTLLGQISLSVVVSAFTSVAISVMTFAAGVRIAKNQGDRAGVRELYKKIFEHFTQLREAISKGRPKTWSNYPLVGNRYSPPFYEIQISGQANMLPPLLADVFKGTEAETLVVGSQHLAWAREHLNPIVKAMIEDAVNKPASPISGRSYHSLRPGAASIMDDDEFNKFAHTVEASGNGVGFELSTEPGRTDVLYAHPEKMNKGSVPT